MSGPLIGDLLVKAKLVSTDQIAEVLPISKRTKLPLGRILVSSGAVGDDVMRAALIAQTLIRENLVNQDVAVNALSVVGAEGLTIEEALKKVGWRSEYYELTNMLGQLLREAQLINQAQLQDALAVCIQSGLPIGRSFVLNGVLTEYQAYTALTAQILIREGAISREQAIQALRNLREHQGNEPKIVDTLRRSDFQGSYGPNIIRLGELLILAGLVSELDLISAVEHGLLDGTPIGEVLVSAELISPTTLEQTLEMQKMVTSGKLHPLQASEALRMIRTQGISLQEAVERVPPPSEEARNTIEVPELLKMVGLLTHADVVQAVDFSSATQTPIEQVLMIMGLVDINTYKAAQRVRELLVEDKFTPEQCVYAMQCYIANKDSFEKVVTKLLSMSGRQTQN